MLQSLLNFEVRPQAKVFQRLRKLVFRQVGPHSADFNESLAVCLRQLCIGLQHAEHICRNCEPIPVLVKKEHLLLKLLHGQVMHTVVLQEDEEGVKADPVA